MEKKILITGKWMILALMALMLHGCIFFNGKLIPSKTKITRTYKVKDFTSVSFRGAGNIEYTQTAGQPSFTVTGPQNYVDMFDVEVDNGTLVIKLKDESRSLESKFLKISLSSRNLTNIDSKGVGNIHINRLNCSTLEIINKGVGNIRIDSINGGSLTIQSLGVGNVIARGKVSVASLTSDGVGNIEADELLSKVVDANSHGVGNITCFASDSITATVKGVGSIRYRGEPKFQDTHSSGVGSIKKY